MSINDKLITIIQRSYDDERNYLASMTDEERQATGILSKWSPKDNLAHVAAWKLYMADWLATALRGEKPVGYGDLDQANEKLFEEYQNSEWPEVIKLIEQAQREIVAGIQEMREEDLLDPHRYKSLNGRPLWQHIIVYTQHHSTDHVSHLYRDRGDVATAQQVQERGAQDELSLDNTPDYRGTVLYNHACLYALAGEKERAITNLRQAFELSPKLVDWSRKDSDLDSIRESASYQELISS